MFLFQDDGVVKIHYSESSSISNKTRGKLPNSLNFDPIFKIPVPLDPSSKYATFVTYESKRFDDFFKQKNPEQMWKSQVKHWFYDFSKFLL